MAIRIAGETVGHRRLKNHLSEVLRETVHQGVGVPISNHGQVDGYLMPPEALEPHHRSRTPPGVRPRRAPRRTPSPEPGRRRSSRSPGSSCPS